MVGRMFLATLLIWASYLAALCAAGDSPFQMHPHALRATQPAQRRENVAHYKRNVTFVTPTDFLNAFNVLGVPDPSGGVVEYVNRTVAEQLHMIGPGQNGGFRFGADTSERNITGTGRKSLRLKSKDTYGHGLYVFHVAKAPTGCGAWPALWTVLEVDWPTYGEIDILEWSNGRRMPNAAALHTDHNCTTPGDQGNRFYSGTSQGVLDCDTVNGNNGNAGCSIEFTKSPLSSGALHNANGGGYHVMERTDEEIRIWFFTECSAPAALRNVKKAASIDTSGFGEPDARWASWRGCDISKRFAVDHNIIMNLSFCGLAQKWWEREGCLAVGPDCSSWTASTAATDYYKSPGKTLDFDLNSLSIFSPA